MICYTRSPNLLILFHALWPKYNDYIGIYQELCIFWDILGSFDCRFSTIKPQNKQTLLRWYVKFCHINISSTSHMAHDPNITIVLWFKRRKAPFETNLCDFDPLFCPNNPKNYVKMLAITSHVISTSPQPLMWPMTQK